MSHRVDNPHFGLPFTFGSEPSPADAAVTVATVKCVEQETPADYNAQVQAVFLCPVGFRDELPEFGMPSFLFKQAPIDLDPAREAIAEWVPGVNPEITEDADLIDESIRRVQVNLSVREDSE